MPESKGEQGVLFFVSMPDLKELCCLTILVSTSEKNKDNVNAFQPQVIKCREIIFTEPDVLASPLLGASKKVQIILKVDLYQTGRLQARLQRMNIQAENPKPVTAAQFQSCLQYTLNARLAPLWNKVGSYMVEGREFMTSIQKMNAVSLNATVNESELYLRLSASVVKCPPVGLSDLDVCAPVVDTFLDRQSDSGNVIEEYSIGNKWCYILPSMKRGQIVNILREIPSDSPFSSYKSMKKYWKNMYGYRLPETEEGLLYYQIYFKPIGNSLFTYPDCCVRMRDLGVFNCPNTNVVLQQFLTDFQTKMPSICGKKVVIQSKGMYPVPGLNVINPQAGSVRTTNLSEKCSTVMKSQYMGESTHKNGTLFTPWKPITGQIPDSNRSSLCSQKRASLPLQKDSFASDNKTGPCVSQYFKENPTEDRNVNSSAEKPKANKIIPMFGPKVPKTVVSNLVKPFGREYKKIPVFGKAVRPHIHNVDENGHQEHANRTQKDTQWLPDMVNVSHKEKDLYDKRLTDRSIPTFAPKHRSNFTVSTDYTRTSGHEGSLSLKYMDQPSSETHPVTVHKMTSSYTESAENRILQAKVTPVQQKRKAEAPTETPKKPRLKPKVQEGVDMKQMAQTNQLQKLNSQTLLMWLKSKGVPCKSKDKKAVLIEKVLAVIQIAGAEQ